MAEAYHQPVLVEEVCTALVPCLREIEGCRNGRPARVLVDATCGGGGHTLALLQAGRPDVVVALDRDSDAISETGRKLAAPAAALEVELHLIHAPNAQLTTVLAELGVTKVSALLADLGVSSHQLDSGPRGFSFRQSAPLDMRMDRRVGLTAAQVLATIDESDLAKILREYGEESDAKRIARAVCQARPTTTLELANCVADAMSARQRRALGLRIHPATRTFQALRIHVNGELEQLEALLQASPEFLAVGGRMGVITFHSLEDRPVKRHFSRLSKAPQPPAGLPILATDLPRPRFCTPRSLRSLTPSAQELAANPRSRSSRLRVLERLAA
ncbi:MAG: 16S rRNA (cytosine(1402)-N(4))-methyltransferase RsmH [Nannocystaceae bacterium]